MQIGEWKIEGWIEAFESVIVNVGKISRNDIFDQWVNAFYPAYWKLNLVKLFPNLLAACSGGLDSLFCLRISCFSLDSFLK